MFHLIGVLVAVGVILYLINNYIPMDAQVKQIVNVVAIICIIVWLCYAFGVFPARDVPVPQLP